MKIFVETYKQTDLYIKDGGYYFRHDDTEHIFDTLSDAYDYLDNAPILNS